MLLITIIYRPRLDTLDNVQVVIDMIAWALIYILLLKIGEKVETMNESGGTLSEYDTEKIDTMVEYIIWLTMVILFAPLIIQVIKMIISFPSIYRKVRKFLKD